MDAIKYDKEKNKICSELEILSGNLSNFFTKELQDLIILINYLETLSNEFINMQKKLNKTNNIDDYIKPFFDFHDYYLSKLNNISVKTKNDILPSLKLLKNDIENDNKNIIFDIKNIINQITTQQNIINNKYEDYYNEMKKLEKIGNNLNEQTIISQSMDNKYLLYSKEINKIKNSYIDYEKKYKSLKKLFDDNNKKKLKLISNSLYSYFTYFKENFPSIDNNSKKIDIKKLLKNYQITNDINKNKSNIKNNNIFNNSKILNDTWKYETNGWEEIQTIDNYYLVNNLQPTTNSLIIEGIDYEYMDFVNVSKNNNNKINSCINDYENIINNFFKGINAKENLNNKVEEILKIFERYTGDKRFYLNFLQKFLDAQKNRSLNKKITLYEFKLFSNLAHLTNLMSNILENISSDLINNNLDAYNIFDIIICIGEKSVYENTFMCSLLCKNKIFKNKLIWKYSIKNKIIKLLNEICEKEYKSNDDDSLLKKFNDVFGNINGLVNYYNTNTIEICKLGNKIEYYNKLNIKQKEKINKSALSIFHDIIKCYIRHITNYNYKFENKVDIIIEICNVLHLMDDEHSIYYSDYYFGCLNSSKKIIQNNFISNKVKHEQIQKKISLIKSNNKKEIIEMYPCVVRNDSEKFFIIKHIFKYLNDEDKCKLIRLGKYYMNINKNIFKYLLKQKNISLRKRIKIWKSYLKCNYTKKIYNYSDILKEINKETFKTMNIKSIKQINKDIHRTYFKEKNEETMKYIWNILNSFVYANHKINYSQGMNSIAGFLYDITKNEEETFHIMVSLFNLTQLSDIFDEDFKKLKIFFYVSERLVYLYLPKIFSKLKDNDIQLSYFISAYFITLFTNLYCELQNNDIYFIFRVWDEFIIDGWKAFFSILLAMLKYHENIILSKDEGLISYLSSHIKKSELFKKENYDIFYKLKKSFIINDELLRTLEEEVTIETGMIDLGTSTIIENFNKYDK